jgi:hypothetical protein
MNAIVPASFARKMEADMIDKALASKSASARGAELYTNRYTVNPTSKETVEKS